MKYMSKIYFEKYAQLTLGLTDFGDTFNVGIDRFWRYV